MRHSTTLRRGLVAGAALTLAFGLGGCSTITDLFGGSSETRDDEGAIIEGGTTDAMSLKVGDCFNSADLASEFSEVPTIPCSEPHEDELFFEFTMPDGEFPGEEAFTAAAAEQCTPAFEEYVGKAYADSTLDFWSIYPTQMGWEDEGLKDRLVQCAVYDTVALEAGEMTEGSLKGAAR